MDYYQICCKCAFVTVFLIIYTTTAYDINTANNTNTITTINTTNTTITTTNATPQGEKIPLIRLTSNSLLKYTAYKDVSILHFHMPSGTRTAFFSFKAFEEPKSTFQRKCTPKDVSIYLKAGSYPVISPENITFPRHFLNANERFQIYELHFQSDSVTKHLDVNGPYPGNWFGVAFISWTDPNNDRIEQQGLAASCETLLQSDMSIIRTNPIILNVDNWHNNTLITNSTEPINYKFFVPRNVFSAIVRISLETICTECPGIEIQIQANAVPSNDTNLCSIVLYANDTNIEEIELMPRPSMWHYIDINFIGNNETINQTAINNNEVTMQHQIEYKIQIEWTITNDQTDIDESSVQIKQFAKKNFEFYPLLRQTHREFFMFEYDLLPDVNGTVPAYINLTGGIPGGFRFQVGDVYDIGGTLSFAIAIVANESLKDDRLEQRSRNTGAVAEKLVDRRYGDRGMIDDGNVARNNQSIIVCMRLEEPGIPTWPNKCLYGKYLLPAASIINNTKDDTSTGLIHVPFPESGNWFVTLGVFCYGEATTKVTIIDSIKEFIKKHIGEMNAIRESCPCRNQSEFYKKCVINTNCLSSLSESNILKIKECLMDSKCTEKHSEITEKFQNYHKSATEQSYASDASCTSSAVFTISSSPCVAGRCGRYGRCYHYMSGGFVFSTCLCIKGYRGWDCTENSHVPSSFSILLALLLLTLSNLLFIPSIYFAYRRMYYTESVIYFFAMFFSIFYHACDSGEDEYSFCLVKIGVLQFCDFYCGLLAIWVTLIAMAHIRQNLVSLLHMFGAILLAFGTELNKQSLWVFLAPALTGICIISVSWGLRCRQTKKWFPSRKYLAIYLPIGMILVMIGLVCYAFLQTRQNYHVVHSIWHMVMAISILCLLPSRHSFLPKC